LPPEESFLRTGRSGSAILNFQKVLVPSMFFSSCLHILSRLPVSSTLSLITCLRRQFVGKKWLI
jgi:hypothetical protein